MGFWKDLLNTNESRIKKLISYISKLENYNFETEAIDYLQSILKDDGISSFCGEEVLCDIVEKIISGNYDFNKSIFVAKQLYKIIIFDESKSDQVQLFNKLFDSYLSKNFCISDIQLLYGLFNDKKILLLIVDLINTGSNYQELIEYIKRARQYYIDENAFLSSIVEVAEKLEMYWGTSKLVIQNKLKEDKINSGNIDVDSDEIDKNFKKLAKIESDINNFMNDFKVLRRTAVEMNAEIEKNLTNILNCKVDMFIEETKKITNNIDKAKEDILNISDIQKKKITNHGENYIKLLDQKIGLVPEQEFDSLKNLKLEGSEIPVNKYFDESIPFKDRFEMVKLAKDEKKLYHYTFDEILNKILMNKPVMLVGPSGSGKSYTAKQIASLLGIKLYNFGFIVHEITAIEGDNDYQGNFVKTSFYEIYKNGGLCFFDGVDNSESKALMELNKIIGLNGYKPYLFPNGEIVKPHPNFRIIAAGNTRGDGAGVLYSTGKRLDAATMNRFVTIYYEYDKKIEKQILKDYLDMYEFAVAFRSYIDKRKYNDIISTRDMENIKHFMDNGISLKEILEIYFIKGKGIDVLNSIAGYMDDCLYANEVNYAFKKIISER